MVTRWSKEKVDSFREWHKARILELYPEDEALRKELDQDRERFLSRVIPKGR